MTASERLRQLDTDLMGKPWDVDWNAPSQLLVSDGTGKHLGTIPGHSLASSIVSLRNVLPELIAVVEAAEGTAGGPLNADRNASLGDLVNSLAALEEKLT